MAQPKIAILGTASASKDLAPFDDPSWEIWGLAGRRMKRCSRLFEIHDLAMLAPGEVEFLARNQIPVVMRAAHPGVPTSVAYPLEEVRHEVGRGADIFTSSAAYMMALAIYYGAAEIGVYGVDMLTDSEYAHQRPAMEYLIGIARGRDIEVHIPPQSALCKANYEYGAAGGPQKAQGVTEDVVLERLKVYRADRAVADQQRLWAEAQIKSLDGRIAEAESILEYVRHYNRGGVIPGKA